MAGVAPRVIAAVDTALRRGLSDATTMRQNAAAILESPAGLSIVDSVENLLHWLDEPPHLWFDT